MKGRPKNENKDAKATEVREELHHLVKCLMTVPSWNQLPKKLPILSQLIIEELQAPKTRSQTMKFLLEFVMGKAVSVPPVREEKPSGFTVSFEDDPENQYQIQA